MNLDIADTSRYSEKLEVYKREAKSFAKVGFIQSIAEKVLATTWLTTWDLYHLFCCGKKIPAYSFSARITTEVFIPTSVPEMPKTS